MKKERIYVIDIEFPNNFNVECLEDLDSVDDQQAIADFDAFCDNVYSVLRNHGFDIFADEDSDNEDSLSQYLITFKGEDFDNADIKVIVFIRLSDHRLGRAPYQRRARQRHYDRLAQEYKMPIDKEHQNWEFINIVARGNEVKDYRGALNHLDERLDNIEETYYKGLHEDAKTSPLIGREVIITARDSWLYGEWGTVRYFDGEYYHIAPWNGEETMVFTRDEFRVRRK